MHRIAKLIGGGLALALTCVVALGLSPRVARAEIAHGTAGELSWVIEDDGELVISGDGAMPDYRVDTPVSITTAPWGPYSAEIRSVSCKDGVTSIGRFAFCFLRELSSLELGDGVSSIGEGAFFACTSLASVSLPSTLKSIGDNAFDSCALQSICLPEGLETIGASAFMSCDELGEVTLPSTITHIDDLAFFGNLNLSSVTFRGSDAPEIGNQNFDECSALSAIYVPAGSRAAYEAALPDYKSLIKERATLSNLWVLDDDNLTELSPAFDPNVTEYTLAVTGAPEALTVTAPATSGDVAVNGAMTDSSGNATVSVTPGVNQDVAVTVTSGDGVVTTYTVHVVWSAGAGSKVLWEFDAATGVLSITGEGAMPDYQLGGDPESPNDAPWVMYCSSISSVTVERGVASIGKDSFWNYDELSSVSIAEGVVVIGEYAFGYCDGLSSVSLPSTLETIASNAFSFCSSLTAVTVPEGVRTIGSAAYHACRSLVELTLPASLESIDTIAFYACDSLASVTFAGASAPSLGDSAFGQCNQLSAIYVPAGATGYDTALPSFQDKLVYGAALESLVVDGYELAPTYFPGTAEYALTVPAITTALSITPTAHYDDSTITVGGMAVASGTTTTAAVPAAGGAVEVTVARSAEDVRTYVISVTPEFAVTAQPQDASVTEGADATFSVVVGGAEGLTYQWYLSTDDGVTWTKIDGANGASLTVAGTTVDMSGYRYVCAIQGALGSVMTDAATLTVTERPYVPPYVPPVTPSGVDWGDVMDDVADAEAGGRVVVDMVGETELPGEVLGALAGRDVTLVLEMGEGVAWEVWGGDVPEGASFSDLDMGVEMGTSTIPVDVVDLVTGEAGVVQVTLAHDGPFGFGLTLVAPLGERNDGLFANLYRYDEEAGSLRYECTGVGDDGAARLRLDHASQWAVALDSRSHALPFGDAGEGQWYSEAVRRAWLSGVMTGYADGSGLFGTGDALTRAQMAAVLHNAAGRPEAEVAGLPSDCDESAWYAGAVAWALSEGLFHGYGDGSAFGPDDPLIREQAAAVLRNAAGGAASAADLSPFSDASEVSEWAEDAVSWAVSEGVLRGHAGLLEPARACTRAEAAALVTNLAARG